jgi:hypothetical protein
MRDARHRREMGELRRATERAQAETALAAAEHVASAQHELGGELAWKKRNIETLDLDLALAERRAILRQHLAEQRQISDSRNSSGLGSVNRSAVEEALHEARAQLRANGLDTSALDEILGGRGGR